MPKSTLWSSCQFSGYTGNEILVHSVFSFQNFLMLQNMNNLQFACRYPNCDEEEEREVRRAQRGCVHSRYCLGCVHCVCLGCTVCRFNECECPSCVEFFSRSASREPGREVATQTSLTKALNSPLSLPVPACKDR